MSTEDTTPAEVGSNDQLGPLVPCPMCGADKGYTLTDGSTYRWWSVRCSDCGQEVGECRSSGYAKMKEPKPARDKDADEVWNDAGAYAERLRLVAAEYNAWIRFHDAGEGDFADFMKRRA